ncbi:Bifunctional peptidase and arginyl-hydroxylase JMJD5 (JmjC domain-containing protein 5) (Jumonji C domain-containing protein 5) (L-arginine (3R)-hydroxylase KDM8) (Lysine-specific demethylase 8) [Durusdinium trenchii]|uniref:Bifunctional peptidase and arginyl-hydroxylase JMJD5 (JmjC domain-containing protein 5) (Jumonji C domain-containing protein 5) (L-arginine (3R)-hydroxylase KDM8) (Lysine-specific demethylase 8) n=1 Tax=Durusdinium trenchii TaxID=1381693 RepID=A0ABP0JRE1_9DINO
MWWWQQVAAVAVLAGLRAADGAEACAESGERCGDGGRGGGAARVEWVEEPEKLGSSDAIAVVVGTMATLPLLEDMTQVYPAAEVRLVVCPACLGPVNSGTSWEPDAQRQELALLLPATLEDEACLLAPGLDGLVPKARAMRRPDAWLAQPSSLCEVVDWVNRNSGLERELDGSLSSVGRRARELEERLETKPLPDASCTVVAAQEMTPQRFKDDFVLAGRPVVISGGASQFLPGLFELNMTEFLAQHENETLDIKVVPRRSRGVGFFECSEELALWDPAGARQPPRHVQDRLLDRNRVLVRPAHVSAFPVHELLELFRTGRSGDTSVYVEYFRMFDALLERAEATSGSPHEVLGIGNLEASNMWLGAGGTVGCLHFDPFDNLLGQVSGSKTFWVLPPGAVEEGHLREARFSLSQNGTVLRSELLNSTSIVNTPEDTRVAEAAVGCTVAPGDLLFLPAFWWHHVESSEAGSDGWNMAVNNWYSPVWRKPFPCTACKRTANLVAHRALMLFE